MLAANDCCADRLALAALLLAKKPTEKAIARCKKRMSRALGRLRVTPSLQHGPHPAEAEVTLRMACDMCGRCEGVMLPPGP